MERWNGKNDNVNHLLTRVEPNRLSVLLHASPPINRVRKHVDAALQRIIFPCRRRRKEAKNKERKMEKALKKDDIDQAVLAVIKDILKNEEISHEAAHWQIAAAVAVLERIRLCSYMS